MVLSEAALTKARRQQLIREADAALALSHDNIRSALSDELTEMFPGKYAYLRDVFGDEESGDVVYYCDGDTWRAPYEIGMVNGKRTCAIDDDAAVTVVPRTVYDEEAEEGDHYAGMSDTAAQEAKAMPTWMRRMVLTERFISKSERDGADSGDFAGKGKSFPILKPGDVMAAVRSMGRAGADNKSTGSLKSSIIRIAKRKGWTKYLPKAWQDGTSDSPSSKEARKEEVVGTLTLSESAAFIEDIALREAFKTGYQIKLIAPGKGSSAFYPAEVLKRDGPRVFKAGMPMYINHPTAAEESSRPEGDVKNWGGVLTKDAFWLEEHKQGPGLYSEIKPFSDHVQLIDEKGPYAGVSIRANGNAVMEAGKQKLRDGVPILSELLAAQSVDMVTRAGAGGMFLQESATQQEEVSMTKEEIQTLVEAGVTAALKTHREAESLREVRTKTAREEAVIILEKISLPEAAKKVIVERCAVSVPLKETGELDLDKFRKLVVDEAKAEGEYLGSIYPHRVVGFGQPAPVQETEDQKKLREAREKEAENGMIGVFESLMGDRKAAEIAARGRAA